MSACAVFHMACRYEHPFAKQLAALPAKYPAWQLEAREPLHPPDINATHATYVDTLEALHQMQAVLERAREVAVDLEHSDMCAAPAARPLPAGPAWLAFDEGAA